MVTWAHTSQQTAGAIMLLSSHGEFSRTERGAVVSSVSYQVHNLLVFLRTT